MLDPALFRDDFEATRQRLLTRGPGLEASLGALAELDQARRRILPRVENLKFERNQAGEAIAKLRALNPTLTVLARAHSDAEVKHLLEHGADGAIMAERELAHSLAEMILSTPPYRALRKS